MVIAFSKYRIELSTSQQFIMCILLVNAGNYIYNLVLGRWLGPTAFSNVALLITLLLMLSFLAMTLQLLCAKFIIELPSSKINSFKNKVFRWTICIGVLIGILFISFASYFKGLFNLDNKYAFYLFGIGVPIYFIMSVSRGLHQGKQEFVKLSQSYVLEMFGRLAITFLLIGLAVFRPTIAVTIGILFSFILGVFPNQFQFLKLKESMKLNKEDQKNILSFLLITILYECTQIVINNSDILIVKHYFDNTEAGLYASLALIGRVVYFITWMLIMVLLPKVIEAKKNGDNPKVILITYLQYILILTFSLVTICLVFPETIIELFFGAAYISMSSLLYKYAIATSLFAIANLFVYYFLSLSYYKPVLMAMFFGVTQLVFLILFHDSLEQVVNVQIVLMFILLIVMLYWYISKSR